MNKYLLITYLNEFSSYITQRKDWKEALTAYYKYFGATGGISVEDFGLLISNKTSDEAIKLFNNLQYDDIEFFGVIHQPFICNLIDIDKGE